MARCFKCKSRPAEVSAILKGIYYSKLCRICLAGGHVVSSGQASYNRARDLEEHEADVIQPYEGGLPSARFIHLYPERARQLFSDDQIDKAIRK